MLKGSKTEILFPGHDELLVSSSSVIFPPHKIVYIEQNHFVHVIRLFLVVRRVYLHVNRLLCSTYMKLIQNLQSDWRIISKVTTTNEPTA